MSWCAGGPGRAPEVPAPLAALARTLEGAGPVAGVPGAVPTQGARVAAAAILLRPLPGGDVELVLTRRGPRLAHHPGQVAFPGGRLEVGESPVQAALREAAEEVALRPATVQPLGLLPAFYIPPSRFWLHPVVLHWQRPHPLHPAQDEVAEIFTARVSELSDRRRLRVVQLSSRGATWAWQLHGGRLLWGATGVAVTALLDRIAPGWAGGATPARMGAEHHLDVAEVMGPPGPRPARLSRLALRERPLAAAGVSAPRDGFDAALVRPAGQAVARAARALLPAGASRVAVLAGPGGTGEVGLAAAADLRAAGWQVTVVTAGRPTETETAAGDGAARSALPGHDLVIDALLGVGFRPPLRDRVAALVADLRGTAATQLAVDLPTGLHPEHGPVGEAVAADVTVAIGAAPPVLAVPSAEPFIGDCYLWQPGHGSGLERLLLR